MPLHSELNQETPPGFASARAGLFTTAAVLLNLLITVTTGSIGCGVVDPLAPARRDPAESGVLPNSDPSDAGAFSDPSSSDAGTPPGMASRPSGQDDASDRGVASSPRSARAGERCLKPEDCEKGTWCDGTHVCSVPCIEDSDCPDSSCAQQADGTSVCLHPCDPVTGTDCRALTTCLPSGDLTTRKHASCVGLKPSAESPVPGRLGDPCTDLLDCEDGLACFASADGKICSPWCRHPSDCPQSAPACWFGEPAMYKDATSTVGICISCGVLVPGWDKEAVWTQAQYDDCAQRCPGLDDSECIASCDQGQAYVDCLTQELLRCGGGNRRACPTESMMFCDCFTMQCGGDVGDERGTCAVSSCSDIGDQLLQCLRQDPDCTVLANQTCVKRQSTQGM